MSTQTIEKYAPWSALDPAPPDPQSNHWLGDTVDSVTPRMLLHQHALADGEFAQWNPYVVGGAPGLSIPDGGAFSPLSLPWYVLTPTYAPGMVKVLEIAAITLGMSLLLRRFHLPSAAWALSALIYCSSAFMVAWTNWQQTRVAALVPLLFWSVDKVVTGRRWRDVVPLAAVTAAMLAGGFPSVTGFSLYAAAAYALARTLALTRAPREIARAAVTTISGIVAGVALMAWQLLPFVDHATNVIDFSLRHQGTNRHLGMDTLATAVVPEIFGGPITAYWGLSKNPVETFSYVGAATVALILIAVTIRQRRLDPWIFLTRFSLIALGVTVTLVYIGGLPLALVQKLPIFSNNPIGRATVLFGFFAAVAAAITFGACLRRTDMHRPNEPKPIMGHRSTRAHWYPLLFSGWRLLLAFALAGGLMALMVRAVAIVPPDHWLEIRPAIVRASVIFGLGLAAIIVALAWPSRWTRGGAALLIPILVLVPASIVATEWWPKGSKDYFYTPTPTHQFLAENLGHERFISVNQAMLPGTSSAYRLRAANGHGWHTTEWKDMLRAADPEVMTTATYSTLKTVDGLTGPTLDRLGVRYGVLSPSTLLPGNVEVLRTSESTTELRTGTSATATANTPFRGIILTLPRGWSVGDDGAEIRVEAHGPDGQLVATTDYALENPWPAAQMWIPLAAETNPGMRVRLDITVTTEEEEPLTLAGDSRTALALEVMRPLDDGLRVVHTTGATVVERLTALDRVRWAGTERVVEDGEQAVELLASGQLSADTVLIEHRVDALRPDGSTAQVSVRTDTTDVLEVDITADGAGWLVVGDSLQGGGGWYAYLDGQEVPIVEVDHALGAIAVPSGQHQVALKYEAPGMRVGLVIGVVTALALLMSYLPGKFVRRLRLAPRAGIRLLRDRR